LNGLLSSSSVCTMLSWECYDACRWNDKDNDVSTDWLAFPRSALLKAVRKEGSCRMLSQTRVDGELKANSWETCFCRAGGWSARRSKTHRKVDQKCPALGMIQDVRRTACSPSCRPDIDFVNSSCCFRVLFPVVTKLTSSGHAATVVQTLFSLIYAGRDFYCFPDFQNIS
jgi:hypothetical protein